MIKKVLGGLFLTGALLMLIGAIANGSLFSDQGSTAATYGNFLGTIIPIIIYVLSGIFLLTFDNPTKLNYIDGFKKRSKQSSKVIALFVICLVLYGFLFFFSGFWANTNIGNDDFVSLIIVNVVYNPFLWPFFVSTFLLAKYVWPHLASKRHFVKSDDVLNEYFSANEMFYDWSGDSFVLASKKVLYFPKLFCVIPFNQIASTKFYKELWEKGIYINLVNGKKIYIATKHFERIQQAINAYSQVQQQVY